MLMCSFAFASNDAKIISTFDELQVELSKSASFEKADVATFIRVENVILSDCSGITVTLGAGDSFVWTGSCAGLWRLIFAYLQDE